MACKICDHTRHRCNLECFWCPRCGTLDNNVPKLVERVQKFIEEVNLIQISTVDVDWIKSRLHTLGIKESVQCQSIN